jgi:hypothetical protein
MPTQSYLYPKLKTQWCYLYASDDVPLFRIFEIHLIIEMNSSHTVFQIIHAWTKKAWHSAASWLAASYSEWTAFFELILKLLKATMKSVNCNINCCKRRAGITYSVLSVGTGCTSEEFSSIPGKEKKLSRSHIVQTSSEAYIASYLIGTGGYLAGRKVTTHLHLDPLSRMIGAISLLPHTPVRLPQGWSHLPIYYC